MRSAASPLAMLRDRRGAGAAEFALVLPLLITFLLGIIDVGRFMYVTNMAAKATQMGARFAVVTDTIPPQLIVEDYTDVAACGATGADVCKNGDPITKAGALGTLTCTSTSCQCASGSTCPSGAAIDTETFTRLSDHMANYYPAITPARVTVIYSGSGLGFAGDPTGPDIVPLVTVKLNGLTFNPITLFNSVSFNLPDFATTLSQESAAGQQSN